MVTTRRENGIIKPSAKLAASTPPTTPRQSTTPNSSTSSSTTMPTHQIPPPTHHPYLPTRTEALLLLVYPTTLFLGSLFSHISPTLRPPQNASTYSTLHQSFQPASSAPSYFARKRNIFNVYFVKIGWFWCTFAFFLFLVFVGKGRRTPPPKQLAGGGASYSLERKEQDDKLRRRYQAALRYGLSTLFWVATTQWFFGPPLVDRGFALTGGVCEIAREEELKGKTEIVRVFTHAACNAVGGKWRGGYDISGHVFILVLGSGMLLMEMLPYLLPKVKGVGVGRVVRGWKGEDTRIANELGATELYVEHLRIDPRQEPVKWTLKAYATVMTLGIAVLSWWMLLMTAAFFHTWFEKVTGLLLAASGLWVVYYLPRGLPAVRNVLGMPGV